MLERAVFAIFIVTLGVLAWVYYNRWSVHRLAEEAPDDPVLEGLARGVPTIVYFTTPYCIPCRTLQKPALNALQAEFGEAGVQIIQIDATENPGAADRWHVFSAPTTFVLDRDHKPRHVNRGVATVETLKHQLAAIDAA